MADEREPEREQKEIAPLTAEEVASREFATTFRGYEPTDVRTFLERVAARLRSTEEQSQALRARLDRLQARVMAVEAEAARTPPPAADAALPDEATLLGALGDQAAHILRTAHEGADAITKRAEDVARETVTVAEAEANRMKLQAEAILSSRVRDAAAEADTIVRQAKEDAERIRVSATAEAGRIVDEGRVRGREIVDEAQGVRERVLGDLMKRRRVAQVQIEQLRAGRERLLDAYRVVRRTLEDVTDELQRADAEARGAAEAAGRRLAGEPGRSLPNLGRSGSGGGSGGGSGVSTGVGGSLSGPTSPPRSASPARSAAPAPER